MSSCISSSQGGTVFDEGKVKIQAEQTNSRKDQIQRAMQGQRIALASTKQAFYYVRKNVKLLYRLLSFSLTAQMLWLT